MLGAGPSLGPRMTRRLAVRLVVLLSLALLPIGAIAVYTTAQTVVAARHGADQALVSRTAEAVAGKRALIESAFAAASTLGPPALERRHDLAACRELMAEFVRRSGVFRMAGVIAPDGRMNCVSDGRSADFSGSSAFQRQLDHPVASIFAATPAAGNAPELIVLQPIRDGVDLQGFVVIALPQRALELMGQVAGQGADAPARTVLLNGMGEVLLPAHGTDDPAPHLPAEQALADLIAGDSRVLQGTTARGTRATFAIATLMPGQLYALGVWPGGAGSAATGGFPYWPLVFPLLMWLASLGVAYFAVYRLVIRHVRHLNQQMRRFALGHRETAPEVIEDAPAELREVSATFNKLARILARDEAELAASLEEKTVLLKEVHHRVKNNLQLIASILNLQMRQVSDPAARQVLQSVQDRVIGLSTVHRRLYEADRLSAVRADQLVEELTRQLVVVGAAPGSGITVETRLDPVTLCPDRMVPLSLLLTEAVINALKYVGRPCAGAAAWIDIALHEEAGTVTLSVGNALGPEPATGEATAGPEGARSRLGMQLIEAFAQQLDGTLRCEEVPAAELRDGAPAGARAWQLAVRFPARPGDAPPAAQPHVAPAQAMA